jgi:hypothetical protein
MQVVHADLHPVRISTCCIPTCSDCTSQINILVDASHTVKLTGFMYAHFTEEAASVIFNRAVPPYATQLNQTKGMQHSQNKSYWAPEIFGMDAPLAAAGWNVSHTTAVDIYAFGQIFWHVSKIL